MRKTSIIVLTYNNLEYTKACLESIYTYTEKETYELIVIDNASILMALFLKKDDKLLKNFLSIVVISLVVEYVSAYISEEFFHHRLWDYSHMFLNFEGRICFSMGILFGLVGLFFFYLLLPILYRLYQKHTKGCRYLNVIFIILFFINILIECII